MTADKLCSRPEYNDAAHRSGGACDSRAWWRSIQMQYQPPLCERAVKGSRIFCLISPHPGPSALTPVKEVSSFTVRFRTSLPSTYSCLLGLYLFSDFHIVISHLLGNSENTNKVDSRFLHHNFHLT